MRRDHETTTPEAAAQWDRDNTPAYWDNLPDLSELVGPTVDPDPAFNDWWHAQCVAADRLINRRTA